MLFKLLKYKGPQTQNPICHFDPQLMQIDVSCRAFGYIANLAVAIKR